MRSAMSTRGARDDATRLRAAIALADLAVRYGSASTRESGGERAPLLVNIVNHMGAEPVIEGRVVTEVLPQPDL
jgi:hypothetical protein